MFHERTEPVGFDLKHREEKTASPRKGEMLLPGIGHDKMNRRNLSQRGEQRGMGNMRRRYCHDNSLRCGLEFDLTRSFQINLLFKAKLLI